MLESPTRHTDVGIGGGRTRSRNAKIQPRSRIAENPLHSHPVEEHWRPEEWSRPSLMQSMPRRVPVENLAPESRFSTGRNLARSANTTAD